MHALRLVDRAEPACPASGIVFVPYEIYELTKSISALKIVTLVINLAIVIYLVYAKRLFGVRGGGKVERAELERDTGWPAIERATPQPRQTPAATATDPAGRAATDPAGRAATDPAGR